jgi:hypothetical protein
MEVVMKNTCSAKQWYIGSLDPSPQAGAARRRKLGILLLAGGLLPGLLGCGDSLAGPGDMVTVSFDFTTSDHGWTADFAEFFPDQAERMELVAGHETLPEGIGRTGKGLYIAGFNISDDLFMFWKRQVQGLEPMTTYRVSFEVEFASNAPSGCFGAGGPPAEAVYMKVGATVVEPVVELVEDADGHYYHVNIDKSNQSGCGEDAFVIGTIGTTNEDCFEWKWELVTLASTVDYRVTTDASGKVWLLVGTDSGFEALTELYYTRFKAVFERIPS